MIRPIGIATKQGRDFLIEYLTVAPASLALIRANECYELSQLTFARPLLEIGCGDGLFASQLFAERVDVGLDLHPGHIARATEAAIYEKTVVASVTRIPFAKESFATVFSNSVLEHIDELQAALMEIARVLRTGGRLIATVPCAHFSRIVKLPTLMNQFFDHRNLMEPTEWAEQLTAVGLRMIQTRHYNSPAAIRAHQWLIPLGLGACAARSVTGHCVPRPSLRGPLVARLWAKLLRPYYGTQVEIGGSVLWIAEKT